MTCSFKTKSALLRFQFLLPNDSFLGHFTCNLQEQIESYFLHIERPVSVYIKLCKECSRGDWEKNN